MSKLLILTMIMAACTYANLYCNPTWLTAVAAIVITAALAIGIWKEYRK